MSGKLYIVPTPVGNLDDMSVRAVNTLKEAGLILAEDTRTSGVLMKHFGIETRMQSHHKFNEHETINALAERLEAGEVIAMVSDAGTPAISDPGFLLVRECRRRGIEVECLPGPTAFLHWSIRDCLVTSSALRDFCRKRKAVQQGCSTWQKKSVP